MLQKIRSVTNLGVKIKTQEELEKLIYQFKEQAIFLENYISVKNSLNNPDFDPKQSIKLGLRLTKIASTLIKNNIERLIALLDDADAVVAKSAAEYLYPVHPKKCLNILKKYHDMLDENLDKLRLRTKIDGLIAGEEFFINEYRKLYGIDDISSLNRENEQPFDL